MNILELFHFVIFSHVLLSILNNFFVLSVFTLEKELILKVCTMPLHTRDVYHVRVVPVMYDYVH